jgi:hypothetical protein
MITEEDGNGPWCYASIPHTSMKTSRSRIEVPFQNHRKLKTLKLKLLCMASKPNIIFIQFLTSENSPFCFVSLFSIKNCLYKFIGLYEQFSI